MSEGTAADQFFHQTALMQGSGGRVKRPSESYSTDRPVGLQKSTGRPWRNTPGVGVGDHPIFGGRDATLPAEKDYAMLGALAKLRASRQLRYADVVLSDHEVALVRECCETEAWSGEVDGHWVADYRDPAHVKAILDGTTSGGSYLNPTFFDDMVVTYPLLYGELVPYVDVQDVPRGSSIETASVNNPTVTWNQSEGSAIDLFDTTGLIADITATVFPVMVAVEIGRDVLADSAVNLGRIIAANIGERIQSELDNQIANGDGTSEPEGIFTASGTTAVASESGTASAYTVGDVERHVFGLDKQYRVDQWNPRFVMSDTAYRRMSQVPVGASDARRVLHPQMDHESYTLMGRGVSVQNNIANGYSAFAALKKAYRLWRRQGAEMRWSEEGATLMRANTALLAVRARFGGKVIDPNAVAVMSDGDSTDG